MIDIDGLDQLTHDLSAAPGKVQRQVDAVVRKGAQEMVDDWRRLASGLRHAPAYPRSVTFDAQWKRGAYEAEVGPDKDLPQGALGNLITYGSVNNPPTGHDVTVSEAQAPKFERAIEGLVDL